MSVVSQFEIGLVEYGEGHPMSLPEQFIRRYREPFHESFCRLCVRQVGMAKEESALIRDEKNHLCDPHSVEMAKKLGIDPVKLLKQVHKISN
jgi:hypothetical protein